jgi:predicted DNA-binding WGR domain protein
MKMWTWLTRIDPEDHANRYYAVGVQPSLLDPVALIRSWGSRETDYCRLRVEPFEDWEAAREAADRLIRDKLRRGYRLVGGYRPVGIEELVAGEPVAGDGER